MLLFWFTLRKKGYQKGLVLIRGFKDWAFGGPGGGVWLCRNLALRGYGKGAPRPTTLLRKLPKGGAAPPRGKVAYCKRTGKVCKGMVPRQSNSVLQKLLSQICQSPSGPCSLHQHFSALAVLPRPLEVW